MRRRDRGMSEAAEQYTFIPESEPIAQASKKKKSIHWDDPHTTITTKKNVVRWYAQHGIFQISRPDWVDDGGKEQVGKTVTLDVDELPQEAKRVFIEILLRIS